MCSHTSVYCAYMYIYIYIIITFLYICFHHISSYATLSHMISRSLILSSKFIMIYHRHVFIIISSHESQLWIGILSCPVAAWQHFRMAPEAAAGMLGLLLARPSDRGWNDREWRLLRTVGYWDHGPFVVDFPMKNGDFPIVFCMFTWGYIQGFPIAMLDYRVVHRAKTVDMLSPQEWVFCRKA